VFDRHLKTKIMNEKGYEKAGFLKRFLMPVNSLDKIKNTRLYLEEIGK